MACATVLSASVKQMTPVVAVLAGMLLSLSMAQVNTQRVLCGRTLADTLDLVCAGRGFYSKKRSVDSLPVKDTAVATRPGQESPKNRVIRTATPGPLRSVVDECCRRPCTYSVLESYCAPMEDTSVGSEQDLVDLFGSRSPTTQTSTLFTTTQSTAHYDPNSPSAEVFRGPSRGYPQNGRKFFYVQVGSRPTRNPLISE